MSGTRPPPAVASSNPPEQIMQSMKRQVPFSSMKPPFVAVGDYHCFAPDHRRNLDQDAEAIVVKTPQLKRKTEAVDFEADSGDRMTPGSSEAANSPFQTPVSGKVGKGGKSSRLTKCNKSGIQTPGSNIDWLNGNMLNSTKLEVVLQWCNVWATGCYYLWYWRNKYVHEEGYSPPNCPSRIITQNAMNYESSKHLSVVHERTNQVTMVHWRPAATGWTVINTDGAFKSTSNVAGCGAVVRNSDGFWIGGIARRLFVDSAYLAELWGVIDGINLAASKGYTDIELQLDSSIVVNCLTGTNMGSIAGRQLVRRIRHLLACFSNVRILHIYREANKVADALANLGCTFLEGFSIIDTPPPSISLLVDADVVGVSTPRVIPV